MAFLAVQGDGIVVNQARGELFVRAWQTEDGLPENMVVSAAQTPDHYLWVATHLGLFRFDGVKFEEAIPVSDAGIATGIIRVMQLDPSGRLWLAKDRGALVCLDQGKVTQALTPEDGLSTFQTRSLAVDQGGNIWLSDSQGNVFRVADGRVQRYGLKEGLLAQSTCWLASDVNGQIWFSQQGQVGVFSNGHFASRFTVNAPSARIQAARDGGVWLCDGQKIYRAREGGLLEPFERQLPLPAGVEVTALYEDRQNRLWVGTLSHGLFCWDGHEWQTAPVSHASILGISEDAEGNIWVGTQGGGLNRVRSRALEVLGPKDGLPFNTVQSVCALPGGEIWAVGQNGQLARKREKSWSVIKSEAGWHWGPATCVAAAPDGIIFVGTRDNGIIRYQDGKFAPLNLPQKLGATFIRLLTVSTNGDLWIGSDPGDALHRIRHGEIKSFSLASTSQLRATVEGLDGDLWVATAGGQLLRIHEETVVDETSKTLTPPYPIRTLCVTADGSLWIGYAGRGVGRLKDDHFLLIRESDGLWDDYVSQIASDDNGRLWIAGNRGVFYVLRKDLDALAERQIKRIRSVAIGRGEGLPNLQASFDFWPNATRSREGHLLMTMLSGLAVINGTEATTQPKLPPVTVEQVTVNEQVVAAHDVLASTRGRSLPLPPSLRQLRRLPDLGPGVQQMDIEYTAFSYAAPENLEFRYQLKGRDTDWILAANQRKAHFGTLAPGEYSFELQSRTYDSDWNETGASLSFKVQPYLWQTWWFRSGCVIALLALTGGTIRYVERKRLQLRIERLERERAVERERTRIAKDIHDELGSQLTGITILSDLAQSAEAPRPEILSDMRKIGAMSRGLTRSLAEIVWAVNPRNDNLESFVTYACHFAEEFLRPAGVRCFLEVPEVLPPVELSTEFRHNLFMMMKEAVNNVVKHARATQVRICINLESGRFKITIADDGCGFQVPTTPTTDEKDSNLARRPSGNGLENMRHRIENLGGEFNLSSAPGTGTKIEATLTLVREP